MKCDHAPNLLSDQTSVKPRAMVYMLDAARADVLEAVKHTVWETLNASQWAEGYSVAWSVTATNEPYAETNSGPNHVTIATGMLLRNHHIADNDTIWTFNGAATPTWLERLGQHFPEMRTAFAFSWLPDLALAPEHGRCVIVCGNDEKNNQALAAMLRRAEAPEAIMVYDDAPDHAGHEYGFYPYSPEYLTAVENSLSRLGRLLDEIRTRSTFAEEDWLIVVCADHGGMAFSHGMSGGQASTVPLLYCGKAIPAGMLEGRPTTVDIAAQVLRHFGLENDVEELDGKSTLQTMPLCPTPPLTEKLLYDLTVINGQLVNAAGITTATLHGDLAADGGGIDPTRGFVSLDALNEQVGEEFTFAVKFTGAFSGSEGKQVLLGNRDFTADTSPGIVLMVEKGDSWALSQKKNRVTLHAGAANAPRTFLAPQPDRMDFGDVLIADNEESLLAVSVKTTGLLTVFQRSLDTGYSNWFCVDATGIRVRSHLPWNLGQDGTGKYKFPATVKIKKFRFWNRALTLEQLKSL